MEVIKVFSNLKRKLLLKGEFKKFSSTFSDERTSDTERIAMTMKYLKEFGLLPFKKTDSIELRKRAQVSIDCRNDGNKCLLTDNQQALVMYSKSIAAAPYPTGNQEDSKDLALSFANRSAVYFLLQKYAACVKDIDHALEFQYPDPLTYKLYERRGMCCQKLSRLDEAAFSFQEALKHLPQATFLPAGKRDSIFCLLESLSRQVSISKPAHCCAAEVLTPLPDKAFGQHTLIPCAADCLDIKYSPTVGRHVVANKDIDPGDILFVEEPFASVVLPENCLTHCNNCLKRSDAMIPCKVCDLAMYCSETCRLSSWKVSHSIECWLIPALLRLDVGESSVFLLPLRMLLTACRQASGLSGLQRYVKTLEDERPDYGIQGLEASGQYDSLNYRQMHHLCHHTIQDPDFQLAWATGVASIVNCLDTQSDFFTSDLITSNTDEHSSHLQLFTGGLLLKYIGIISTNCFSVTEWVISKSVPQVNEMPFGNAIYLTVSFLNHSCYPNALNSFHHGDVHIVSAKRPIRRGEEIAISYGASFTHSEHSDRRLELRMNYCFECECIACSSLWPTFKDLQPLNSPVFICHQCRGPLVDSQASTTCIRCGLSLDRAKLQRDATSLMNRIIDIYHDIKSGSQHDHKPELAASVKALDRIVQSPSQLTAACQQYLRYSMKITGNIYLQAFHR